jgi:hypothetical protein
MYQGLNAHKLLGGNIGSMHFEDKTTSRGRITVSYGEACEEKEVERQLGPMVPRLA